MVNPKSRSLARVGLYSFQIKGSSHQGSAVKSGDFRPGVKVILRREPENPHDPNAIAVHTSTGRTAGYVNKQNAARLAKRLDAGDDIIAVSIRGSGPGSETTVPRLLAAERRIIEHLLRELR